MVGVDPKTVRRERPPDNAEIRTALQKIAAVRRPFSYRRIGLLLERRGMLMNPKKSCIGSIARKGCRSSAGVAARGPEEHTPVPFTLMPNQR